MHVEKLSARDIPYSFFRTLMPRVSPLSGPEGSCRRLYSSTVDAQRLLSLRHFLKLYCIQPMVTVQCFTTFCRSYVFSTPVFCHGARTTSFVPRVLPTKLFTIGYWIRSNVVYLLVVQNRFGTQPIVTVQCLTAFCPGRIV